MAIGGPGSALSVVVTFDNAGTSHQNVALEANRGAGTATYTQIYATSQPVRIGVQSMHARFYSQPGGTGSLVADADASVLVNSDGTLAQANGSPLGTIQAIGLVSAVSLTAPQSVTVGSPEPFQVSVFDSLGDLLAISPGSVFTQIVNGTGSASINAGGDIAGISPGTVSLTATVDGVASTPSTITISSSLNNMTTLTQPTTALAVSPKTGNVWAAVPATDPKNGNCVVEIDPTKQQVVSKVAVGSSPNMLAFSDDGTALYVGLLGSNSFARVDPVGKTLVGTYSLGSTYAASISVEPGNPNIVALSLQDISDSGFAGGCIFSNGVQLPNNWGLYGGEIVAFSSATTLWGTDPGFSPQDLYQGTVNANGSTVTNTTVIEGGSFTVLAGNLYFTTGQVFSGQTGKLLGTYPLLNPALGIAVDTTNQATYVAQQTSTGQAFEISAFNTSTFTSISSYPIPSGPSTVFGLTLLQPGQLVFADGTNVYFLQVPIPPGANVRRRH
jgi:hypothetical protein